MPLIEIHHGTRYTYRQAVSFGAHRIMVRPREGHDQRLIDCKLHIDPPPSDIRWIHDVFGNSVAIATFDRRATEQRFVRCHIGKIERGEDAAALGGDFRTDPVAREKQKLLRHDMLGSPVCQPAAPAIHGRSAATFPSYAAMALSIFSVRPISSSPFSMQCLRKGSTAKANRS